MDIVDQVPELKHYNIAFCAADEDQDYFDSAMLTVDEAANLNTLLEVSERLGYIKRPCNCPDLPFVYEPCPPSRYEDVRISLLAIFDIQSALTALLHEGKSLPIAAEGWVSDLWSKPK